MAVVIGPMAQALRTSLGFVSVTFGGNASTSLYTNPRYPGFLFKAVDTIAQALAAGGVLMHAPTSVHKRSLMYLGLTFERTYHAGKLGEFGRYASFTGTPVREIQQPPSKMPILETVQDGSKSIDWANLLITPHTTDWTDLGGEYHFIAVVSRADEGFLLDHHVRYVDPIAEPAVAMEVLINREDQYLYSTGVAPTGNETKEVICWRDTVKLTQYVPSLSGYIAVNVPFDKKTWMNQNRAYYNQQLVTDGVDQDAIDIYMDAYDATMATMTGSSYDAFVLYPQAVMDTSQTVEIIASVNWTPKKKIREKRTSNPNYPSNSVGGAYRIGGPTTSLNMTLGAQEMGNIYQLPWEISFDSKPMPFYRLVQSGGDAQIGEELSQSTEFWPNQNGVRAQSHPMDVPSSNAFSLASVPYVDVRLFAKETIKASTLFGPISPLVRPAATPAGTLDLSTRMDREFEPAVRRENSNVSVDQTDGTTTGATVAKNRSITSRRRLEYMTLLTSVSPFAAFIGTLSTQLDVKAQELADE